MTESIRPEPTKGLSEVEQTSAEIALINTQVINLEEEIDKLFGARRQELERRKMALIANLQEAEVRQLRQRRTDLVARVLERVTRTPEQRALVAVLKRHQLALCSLSHYHVRHEPDDELGPLGIFSAYQMRMTIDAQELWTRGDHAYGPSSYIQRSLKLLCPYHCSGEGIELEEVERYLKKSKYSAYDCIAVSFSDLVLRHFSSEIQREGGDNNSDTTDDKSN